MNERVEQLFHEVADLSPEERAEYFAAHPIDEETRREVEALVAYDTDACTSLLRDISEAAMRVLPEFEAGGRGREPCRLMKIIGRGDPEI